MLSENKNRIAVVCAHPDDEVLGCGGTIAKHTKIGDEVCVLILAEGITSRDVKRDLASRAIEIEELAKNAKKANDILGVASLDIKNFPDNRMDSVDTLDIVKVIESFFEKHRPNIVYTHNSGDLNIDHRLVNEAVIIASRPHPQNTIETLLFFEVPSSTEWQVSPLAQVFSPNWFVDIEQTLNIKLEAVSKYHLEIRPWPHARSIEAVSHLARWRGASVGVEAAEAFVLGRNLDKSNHLK